MSSVPLPPPYKGQNDQLPLISVQHPFCERMYNMNNIDGTLNLRKGNDRWNVITGAATIGLNIASYDAGTPLLFVMVDPGSGNMEWYDITSGSATLVRSLARVTGDDEVHTWFYNNYLFYFGEGTLAVGVGGPQYYNGSAWGNAAFTWPSNFNPIGGNVYKNRGYLINRLTAEYGYTEIDAVNSGAVTKVNISSLVSSKALLYAIASISMTENVTAENVQAFIFSNGEILVYAGSYPASADWRILSRFRVTPLIYINSVISAKGDTFILTNSEILSLRNLFASGYAAERAEGIGAAIQNRWAQIAQALLNSNPSNQYFIKGLYDDVNDRLVISLPNYVDATTGAVTAKPFQLLYDFKLGAWYEYWQPSSELDWVASACFHDGNIFTLNVVDGGAAFDATTLKLDTLTTYLDDDLDTASTTGIQYNTRTAPLPISKYGANKISAIEVLVESDLYPQTNYKVVADLGRATTSGQTLPALGTTIAKPLVNVGIEDATTVQLDISGTSVSASTGLKISGFNVWYNEGPEGSR